MDPVIRKRLEESIDLLCIKAHATALEHGWYPEDGEVNIPEKLALIHSEVSEALEAYRDDCEEDLSNFKVTEQEGIPYGFAIELADTVIRIADLCGRLGINLGYAVTYKMAYNETRSFRHGNKRA